MELRLACLGNSHPTCPRHVQQASLPRSFHPAAGPQWPQEGGGCSSRGLPLLLLFRKPVQEVLVGAVGQQGGSMGNKTGPDLGERQS